MTKEETRRRVKCAQCGETLRKVPGGHGPVWVNPAGYAACLAGEGGPTGHTPEEPERAKTLAHILAEHRMGPSGCDVPNDPELSEVWDEIQADPIAWHEQDHKDFAEGIFDVDHSTINWGA